MVPQEHGAGKPYPTTDTSFPIYVNGRVVGHVANGIFYKAIKGSKHLLRSPRAIAFDVSSLTDAQAAGATQVQVTDTETSTVYRALITLIIEKGRRFNRRFGDQIFLTLDHWQHLHEHGEAEQLSLFSEMA